MSELKARLLGQTMNEYGCDTKIYLKSEADKVIAELKEIDSKNRSAYYKDLAMMAKDVDRQKYKRCLAMARWCDEMMMSCELRGYSVHRIWANRHQWAMRWKYRWLELAKKFKEAK